MAYRCSQRESRERYLSTYDAAEAARYDAWINEMGPRDHEACVSDLKRHVNFTDGMSILDAGSGTGALCLALIRISGIRVSALEPSAAMLTLLQAKHDLDSISTIRGFCDHPDDRPHFDAGSFDLIASRQLANCLYDPLAAFRNWHYWLRAGGTVVVMDGLFDRNAWAGRWDGFIDTLPLSACRTTATVPYLLEQSGFHVIHAGMMDYTNALPSTQTQRYMVVASKAVG